MMTLTQDQLAEMRRRIETETVYGEGIEPEALLALLEYIETLETLIDEHVRDNLLKLYGTDEQVALAEHVHANVLARAKGDGG